MKFLILVLVISCSGQDDKRELYKKCREDGLREYKCRKLTKYLGKKIEMN